MKRGGARALPAGLVAALSLVVPVDLHAGGFRGDINLLVGQKSLDSDDWKPADDQKLGAIEFTWGGTSWPVQIATDLMLSEENTMVQGVEVEGQTREVAVGVRKIFGTQRVRPYVGAGGALIAAEVRITGFGESAGDDDTAFGYWGGGGVLFRFAGRGNIGLGVRYSLADVTLGGAEGDAGGLAYGIALGYGWPPATPSTHSDSPQEP